jgi:hypothetical protein
MTTIKTVINSSEVTTVLNKEQSVKVSDTTKANSSIETGGIITEKFTSIEKSKTPLYCLTIKTESYATTNFFS